MRALPIGIGTPIAERPSHTISRRKEKAMADKPTYGSVYGDSADQAGLDPGEHESK